MTLDNFVNEIQKYLPVVIDRTKVVHNHVTGYYSIVINRMRFQAVRMDRQYSWGVFLIDEQSPISIYGDCFEDAIRQFVKDCTTSTLLHYLGEGYNA
tara:strand:- start:181 stop:471 length:291 start_codon:yes stop_codon:yes gene_type:complete